MAINSVQWTESDDRIAIVVRYYVFWCQTPTSYDSVGLLDRICGPEASS